MKTQTFILPAHWASYLINDDGDNAEITEINDWVLYNNLGFCIDCGEVSWFSWRNDGPNPFVGNDVTEYTFEVLETNHA